MARGGRRDRGDAEGLHLDEGVHAGAPEGSGAHARGGGGAPEEGAVGGEGYEGFRVRLDITARRVRIDPAEKRGSYVRRLEELMRRCDGIITDPEGVENIQMRAMEVLIRAVTVCYRMVGDAEVEELEREVEALKAREAEAARGRVDYRIERKDPPP